MIKNFADNALRNREKKNNHLHIHIYKHPETDWLRFIFHANEEQKKLPELKIKLNHNAEQRTCSDQQNIEKFHRNMKWRDANATHTHRHTSTANEYRIILLLFSIFIILLNPIFRKCISSSLNISHLDFSLGHKKNNWVALEALT